eukprot:4644234-Prymnesium_polylepis.1
MARLQLLHLRQPQALPQPQPPLRPVQQLRPRTVELERERELIGTHGWEERHLKDNAVCRGSGHNVQLDLAARVDGRCVAEGNGHFVIPGRC